MGGWVGAAPAVEKARPPQGCGCHGGTPDYRRMLVKRVINRAQNGERGGPTAIPGKRRLRRPMWGIWRTREEVGPGREGCRGCQVGEGGGRHAWGRSCSPKVKVPRGGGGEMSLRPCWTWTRWCDVCSRAQWIMYAYSHGTGAPTTTPGGGGVGGEGAAAAAALGRAGERCNCGRRGRLGLRTAPAEGRRQPTEAPMLAHVPTA